MLDVSIYLFKIDFRHEKCIFLTKNSINTHHKYIISSATSQNSLR